MLVQLVQKRQQQEQLVQKHRRQVLEQQPELELEQVLALLFYRSRAKSGQRRQPRLTKPQF